MSRASWRLVIVTAFGPAVAATAYARLLATTTGPNAVTITKRQLARDMLRHDPAASVNDSIELLGEAMATAEYREGVAALGEKRPPRF